MKTVTIKFHEYSKEYNFTAPDFIEIDNFVLVHTLGEFKIVRVVDTELDYDKIYYYSAIDRIVLSDGKIVTKRQYTTDITKAKNFAKYKNDYIEINEEDN